MTAVALPPEKFSRKEDARNVAIGVENDAFPTHDLRVRSFEERIAARASALAARGALALLVACTGRIEGERPNQSVDAAPAEAPTSTAPLTALPPASACSSNSPGPRALRRLTAAEYQATLQDLFGDPAIPLTTVFSDPTVLGFSVDSHALVIQGLGAQQLMDQAESVAHWAVTTHLDKLTSCTSSDVTCRQSFIRQFGERAHRAPLSDDDVAVYDKIFTAESSFNDGVEAVTAAMLQSPYFLYRRELGTKSGASFRLSPHEIASSLSYLFTGSMPDDTLMAAADSGALSKPDQLEQQAARLLDTPRGHAAVAAFMRDWLGLSKLDTVAKDDSVFKLTPSLRKAMGDETRRLIDEAVFTQKAPFSWLLTTNSSFVNQELATHYGLQQASSLGADLSPVTFDPSERDGGLLAQGSLLTALATASEPSPVQRGKMVRMRLLCQALPPPPPQLDTALKPAGGGETTRQHFTQHSQNPVCATCHRKMDPIGFGFEHYDAFGRFRTQDNGQPVDAHGAIVSDAGDDVTFEGVAGLTDYLVNQAGDAVNACMVRYWSYFAFGAAGWSEDQCTYSAIAEQAKLDGFAMQSVIKAIPKTARFSERVSDQ